jgi:REP element-mobilizing transposase RayT
MQHSHLRRLDYIWIEHPILFITTYTNGRRKILASAETAPILVEEWHHAYERHGWHIGRYVVMPEHVHFFCAPGNDAKNLSQFMKCWKEWTSKRIKRTCDLDGVVWHAEFFDHLLRSHESYAQKWDYVLQNPVRAGLVQNINEWPWQGEVEPL